MNEQKKELARHLALRVVAVLCVIVIVLQIIILTKPRDEAPDKIVYLPKDSDEFASGRVIYIRENIANARSSPTELVLIDGEGNREQRLGSFTSSPTWSHDGRYIAIGCTDPSKICILDTSTIPQVRVYPLKNMRLSPSTAIELEAPELCRENSMYFVSVSWSPTNQELALVCSSADLKKQEVCILSLENKSSCWGHPKSAGVRHIDWSPVNRDQLVIATGSEQVPEIYLTNLSGENRVFLDNGWSPAWSSDGRQIAFFRWKDGVEKPDETQWSGGIAAIQPDGTGLTWLYQPWSTSTVSEENIYYYGNSLECRLDWSPDGQYIVFSGYYGGAYNSYIFRLHIDSGEIILLSNPVNLYRNNASPDWGP